MPYFPTHTIQVFLQQYIAGALTPYEAHDFLYNLWDSNNEIQYGANYRKLYDDPDKFTMLEPLGINDRTTRSSGMLTALALYFKNP